MKFTRTDIYDVIIIEPKAFSDHRGYFVETFRQEEFEKFVGYRVNFCQDNESRSNYGVLSWFDFAKEIMKMAKLTCKIIPIETSQYPTPAQRPHYLLLNKTKFKNYYGLAISYWKDSLKVCLEKLVKKR